MTTPAASRAATPGKIDANDLEAMAKQRPDDMFLKGSGVLKLTGAIRKLEAELKEAHAALEAAQPASPAPLTKEQILMAAYKHCFKMGEKPRMLEEVFLFNAERLRAVVADLSALASPQVAPAPVMTTADARLEVARFEDMVRRNAGGDRSDDAVTKWRDRLIAALVNGPAKPGAVAAKLAESITAQAKHWAYMECIDNGDAAEAAEEKFAEMVKELAALAAPVQVAPTQGEQA